MNDTETHKKFKYQFKVGRYTYKFRNENVPWFYVVVAGSRAKNLYKYTRPFKTKEQAEKYLIERYTRIKERYDSEQNTKKELTEKRKNYKNPYKVGDLLHYSYGYSMSLNDFYQIISIKNKTMICKEIASEYVNESGFMSGNVKAIKNSFLDKKEVKANIRIQSYGECITINGNRVYITTEDSTHYENHCD